MCMKLKNTDINCIPADLTTNHYDGIYLFRDSRKHPIVVMRSKTLPVRWCILHGFSSLHFLNHSDAMNYCRTHNYTESKGGTQ